MNMLTRHSNWYAVFPYKVQFRGKQLRNKRFSTVASVQNGNQSPQGKIDVIIVLAGGLCLDGSLPQWVSRRLDCALNIYEQQSGLSQILLTGGGTPHKPVILDSNGHVLHESTVCAEYLLERGVDSGSMVKEIQSYDTIGNGYFSAMLHVLPAQCKNLAVVTSQFHMPRTKAIFNKIYSLVALQQNLAQEWYELDFVSVSDEGIFEDEVLKAREEKEAQSCQQFQKDMQNINSLKEFHQWIYSTHLCYSISRQHEYGRIKPQNSKVLASY
eukprot:TRINITY_DN3113_c0_g1_i7.p3 TRINITY_DN3113_c0_g1~~TRINITY_DN3113_c0_g1_i7.p3  ORF type:complete len:270 (+),score=30.37 TRINITY_DN3113_c0_g1_i7:92-901(+)